MNPSNLVSVLNTVVKQPWSKSLTTSSVQLSLDYLPSSSSSTALLPLIPSPTHYSWSVWLTLGSLGWYLLGSLHTLPTGNSLSNWGTTSQGILLFHWVSPRGQYWVLSSSLSTSFPWAPSSITTVSIFIAMLMIHRSVCLPNQPLPFLPPHSPPASRTWGAGWAGTFWSSIAARLWPWSLATLSKVQNAIATNIFIDDLLHSSQEPWCHSG